MGSSWRLSVGETHDAEPEILVNDAVAHAVKSVYESQFDCCLLMTRHEISDRVYSNGLDCGGADPVPIGCIPRREVGCVKVILEELGGANALEPSPFHDVDPRCIGGEDPTETVAFARVARPGGNPWAIAGKPIQRCMLLVYGPHEWRLRWVRLRDMRHKSNDLGFFAVVENQTLSVDTLRFGHALTARIIPTSLIVSHCP